MAERDPVWLARNAAAVRPGGRRRDSREPRCCRSSAARGDDAAGPDADARRRRDRPRPPGRLRPGVRLHARDELPVDLSAHARLPAAARADDRSELPVRGDRAGAHRQPDHPAPRRSRAAERLSLRVWAADLEPHPRGQQFSLRTEARVGEELVWEEVSTNLRRGSDGVRRGRAPRRSGARRPRTCPRARPGSSRATSAAATPASRATTTRSTSIR